MGMNTQTLREHLLQELEYFEETGKHLDLKSWTLCTGSRHGDDGNLIPRVKWVHDQLEISFSNSSDDLPSVFRPRQVIS